jgi:hypothetical protein
MSRSVRLVTGAVVAAIGVYGSYTLIAYADRDDAPGGMVVGAALMFGSVLLGILIGRPRVKQPHSNAG